MASMAKLRAREDLIYYPAHGPAVEKPRALVRSQMAHRRQREGQILRCLERGDIVIPAMVERMYEGVDKRLYPAAGRMVLAHLLDLELRGKVARDGERWKLAA
jgi:glyoxylase-like metal-dependent hydrolase (beta-lactamase superfamily II)